MYDIRDMIKIEIPKITQDKIRDFIPLIIEEKLKEEPYKTDRMQLKKRWYTGLMGEAALEVVLGIPIIEWKVGDTKRFSHPDIPGYNVGVKSVEFGLYPLISFNNPYSQIFCIKYFNTVFVAGLAEPDILNRYQSEDLVESPKLRELHIKTGFYGFDYLKRIESLEDLEPYKRKH